MIYIFNLRVYSISLEYYYIYNNSFEFGLYMGIILRKYHIYLYSKSLLLLL